MTERILLVDPSPGSVLVLSAKPLLTKHIFCVTLCNKKIVEYYN